MTSANDASYIIKNKTSFSVSLSRNIDVITRMERAGYRLEPDGGSLRVNPARKLTAAQRDWIRVHKAGLLTALLIRADAHLADIADAFTVVSVELLPTDVEPWRATRCVDCAAFSRTDHPNLGHCTRGQPEAPAGLWDTDSRHCEQYQGIEEAQPQPGG